MSLTVRFRRLLRAWHMKRLRSDIAWARASYDSHVEGLVAELARLRRVPAGKQINPDRLVFIVTATGALPFLIIDIVEKLS